MKNGTIAVVTANDAMGAVAASEPLTGTLGAVAVAALKASPVNLQVIVDFASRKVIALTPGADATAKIALATGDGSTLTPDDDSGASRAFTKTDINGGSPVDIDAAIDALLATRKPKLSIAQLVGAIEDALEAEGMSGFVVVDQNNSTVKVFAKSPEDAEEASEEIAEHGVDALAIYTQNVTEASGGTKPFGE